MAKKRTLVPFYGDAQNRLEDLARQTQRMGGSEEQVMQIYAAAQDQSLKRANRFGGGTEAGLRKKLRLTGLHKHPRLSKSLKRAIRDSFPLGV